MTSSEEQHPLFATDVASPGRVPPPRSPPALDSGEFPTGDAAATKIQSRFRGQQVRNSIIRHSKETTDDSVDTEAQHAAAVRIQSRYRGGKTRCAASTNKDTRAITIETAVPTHEFHAGNEEADAALRIQSVYRGKRVRFEQARQTSAASVIQRRYRKSKVRGATLPNEQITATGGEIETTSEETGAAVRIQSCYRGKRTRLVHARQTSAASVIQSRYRAHKSQIAASTKEETSAFKEKHSAAVRIQSSYRGKQARTIQAQQATAATRIQTRYRVHQARAQCAAERQRQHSKHQERGASATLIQQSYRQRYYRDKQQSILTIQRKYRTHHNSRVAAAQTIQQQYKARYKQRSLAASVIQQRYVKRVEAKRSHAACYIQARYRTHHSERADAATAVQKRYRKHKNNADLRLQRERTVAATSIQRRFRQHWGNAGGAHRAPRDTREEDAAVTIGARWRGHKARSSCQKLRDEALVRHIALRKLHQQAMVIQRHARGYLARSRSKQVLASEARLAAAPVSPLSGRLLRRHVPSAKFAKNLEEDPSLRQLLASSVTPQPSPPRSPPTPKRRPVKPAMEQKEKWAQMSEQERLAEAKAFTCRLRRDQLQRKRMQEYRHTEVARLFLHERVLERDDESQAIQTDIGPSSRGERAQSNAQAKHHAVRLAPITPKPKVAPSSKRSMLFGREAFDEVSPYTALPPSNVPATGFTSRQSSCAFPASMLETDSRVPRRRRSKPKPIPLYLRMERLSELRELRENKEREERLARILRDPEKAMGRKAVGVLSPGVSSKLMKRRRTPPEVPRPIFPKKRPGILSPLNIRSPFSCNVSVVAGGATAGADLGPWNPMSVQKTKNSSHSTDTFDPIKNGISSSMAPPILARPLVPSEASSAADPVSPREE